jgi:hypothetical protein
VRAPRVALAACAAASLLAPSRAQAIRPFVTDDARVVGNKLAQLETWVVADRLVLEHNALAAVGPTDWLEVAVGIVHGGVHAGPERGYSITGPIVQAKALVLPARDNGAPGLAFAAGALPPFGRGAFTPPGWSAFSYLAATESLFDEGLLLHANVGVAAGDNRAGLSGSSSRRVRTLVTAGVGLQGRIVGGLHGVGEVYYGDPYDPRTDFSAAQAGFRYIFNARVQMDGTLGSTLTSVAGPGGHAQTEQWGTLGLRLVSSELW